MEYFRFEKRAVLSLYFIFFCFEWGIFFLFPHLLHENIFISCSSALIGIHIYLHIPFHRPHITHTILVYNADYTYSISKYCAYSYPFPFWTDRLPLLDQDLIWSRVKHLSLSHTHKDTLSPSLSLCLSLSLSSLTHTHTHVRAHAFSVNSTALQLTRDINTLAGVEALPSPSLGDLYYRCVRACLHSCVRACVNACMHACVRVVWLGGRKAWFISDVWDFFFRSSPATGIFMPGISLLLK